MRLPANCVWYRFYLDMCSLPLNAHCNATMWFFELIFGCDLRTKEGEMGEREEFAKHAIAFDLAYYMKKCTKLEWKKLGRSKEPKQRDDRKFNLTQRKRKRTRFGITWFFACAYVWQVHLSFPFNSFSLVYTLNAIFIYLHTNVCVFKIESPMYARWQ